MSRKKVAVQCSVYILCDMKIIVQQHSYWPNAFTLCENYDKLLVINNWTKLSIA